MPANWDESEQSGSNAHECGAKTHEKSYDPLPFRSAGALADHGALELREHPRH
jgi:hypothetical protein